MERQTQSSDRTPGYTLPVRGSARDVLRTAFAPDWHPCCKSLGWWMQHRGPDEPETANLRRTRRANGDDRTFRRYFQAAELLC